MKRLMILITILAVLAVLISLIYKEGTLSVNKNDKSTKIFVVKPGQSLNEIANNLALDNLIRNRLVFYLVVKKTGAEKKVQAGDFRLSPSMDVFEIVRQLQHGTLDVWVTVVEGLRKEEIAQIYSQKLNIAEVDFIQKAKEGYLFPDTYLIPTQATSDQIIKIMEDNFETKYAPIRNKIKGLRLTELEAVTLASLVEREAKDKQDRPIVASIILKRLRNDWPLQIDASVQYVVGYQPDEKTWWKKNLTAEDLKIDSPYNDYINTGLPPGPICNPGLVSLNAIAEADINTPYWYYLSDKTGKMHYAKTLEEHNENINKYLQ